MMNVCHNTPIIVNGYTVQETCGGNFRAWNENVSILFLAEGRNGGLYWNVKSITRNGRTYTSQRYHYPYISIAGAIAMYLADNNYLWDYKAQAPLLETRKAAKQAINAQRIAVGKAPLYMEV